MDLLSKGFSLVLIVISHVVWHTYGICYNSKSDVILKNHVIYSFSTSFLINCWSMCESDCRCQSLNYFGSQHICEINDRKLEHAPKDVVLLPYTAYFSNPFRVIPKDCAEVLSSGCGQSGVYTIDPDNKGPFKVYCDQTTNNGGWTVFQRRKDGSVDFYRGWDDYRKGFGNLTGEFWLGLDNIYRLTNNIRNRLRVELEDFQGNSSHAEYDYFAVASEKDNYRMSLGGYKGTAGDSLSIHKGMSFSTKDHDYDRSTKNCAVNYNGAWWYNNCYQSNLNGLYRHGNDQQQYGGLIWYKWKGLKYSVKRTELKIRPLKYP